MRTMCAVGMAAARQIVWKLLALAALLAGLELALAWRWLPNGGDFSEMLTQARFSFLFRCASGLLFAILAWQGMDARGQLGYTLRRLPLSEPAVTTVWAVLHTLCHMVLWAVQILVILILWRMWPGANSILALFVTSYRDGFLHGLLPMQDVSRGVYAVLQWMALGAASAYGGSLQREGRRSALPLICLAVSMGCFPANYANEGLEIILLVAQGLLLAAMIFGIWRREWNGEV